MPILPQTNLSMQDIQDEFTGSHPISLSEYYGAADGVPTSGQISIGDFRGKENWVSLDDQVWSVIGTNFIYVPRLTAPSPFAASGYSINFLLFYVSRGGGAGTIFAAGAIPQQFGPAPHDDVTNKTEVEVLSSDGKIVTFRRDAFIETVNTVNNYGVSAKVRTASTFDRANETQGLFGWQPNHSSANMGSWSALFSNISFGGSGVTVIAFTVPNTVFPHTSNSATQLTVHGKSSHPIWDQAQSNGAVVAEKQGTTHTRISATFTGNYIGNAISAITLEVEHPTHGTRILLWRDSNMWRNDNASKIADCHYEVI